VKNPSKKTKTLFATRAMIKNLLVIDLLPSISQGLNKIFTVLIEQRFARMFEANLECSLWASRLVGEPIKCTRSPPFGICDWQAEHLSLSHIGSIVPCLRVNFAIWNNSVRPDITDDVIIDTDITRIDVHHYVCHP